MLDKSIPFLNVLMKRTPGKEIPMFPLPEGYTYAFFEEGDEKDWAELEAAVLEFPRSVDALVYFQTNFLPMLRDVKRRCIFILDPEGKKVATTTIWWEYSEKRRDPWISWVSVLPEYQGLGLGKSIMSIAMQEGLAIEGDVTFYLHTQTWSHRAIPIYEKFGFHITDEAPLYKYDNKDYEKSLAALEEIYEKAGYPWKRLMPDAE